MGGEENKKGEVIQKSKGKNHPLQPKGRKRSSNSVSFPNENIRMEGEEGKVSVTEQNTEQAYYPSSSQHRNQANNGSTGWNELLEKREENGKVLAKEATKDGSLSAIIKKKLKPGDIIGRATATEKQPISYSSFPSASSYDDDNNALLPNTTISSQPILRIQKSAKCNVSPSSVYQNVAEEEMGVARSHEIGDHHLSHHHNHSSSVRDTFSGKNETRSNFLATADEDYDQSLATHISSDENEHLLSSCNNGCHQHHHKKDGKRKRNRKNDDTITHKADALTASSEKTCPAMPSSSMPFFPVINDEKNGNFWNGNDLRSSEFPLPPSSKSSSSSFYSLCFPGLSRVLVGLSIFSLLLVTSVWFHSRLSHLEREFGLQKERMGILADNIIETERLLNRHPGFVDLEEDDDDEEVDNDDGPEDGFGVANAITQKDRQDEQEEKPVYVQGIKTNWKVASINQNENQGSMASGNLRKQQRVKRRVDNQQTSSSSAKAVNMANYNVEFLNQKVREDKDKSGGPSSSDKNPGSAGESGSAIPDDEWVWLTSYSRIPLLAIQEFCSATKEYCPSIKGPPGMIGVPGKPGKIGEKGEKGEKGDPGHRGHPGTPGLPGLRGPKGENGNPGLSGADGRDGLPGEPGLDGIPGRSGLDGVPGIDGIPGMDGRPGIPGRNGSDGIPGSTGPHGAQGASGPRGLPGPRGPSGNPGIPGRDGIPGVQAWAFGNNTKTLLIPPSILGSDIAVRPLVVNEGENVRLWCSASGVPRPVIKWKRRESGVIPLGSWKTSAVDGPVLNLTRINREHMGEYVCIADNGVTPYKQRNFIVEVHFPPMIRIQNQMIGASINSKATFDCYIEAFPPSVTYWERDGRVLEANEKYHVGIKELGPYKVHMMLNVSRVSLSDVGRYHCVSKNELGTTKGDFTLYEVDPNIVTPPSKAGGGKGVAIYGQVQPEHVDLDDLCPSRPPCPDCPPRIETGKCRSGGFALLDMVGWEIYPLGNLTTPKATNRTQDCVLSAVGKAVFNSISTATAGCWMREPVQGGLNGEKYWVTRMDDTHHLYEYINKTAFTKGHATRNFTLQLPFKGNYHAVFNGSFYYITDSKEGRPRIVRLDLFTGKTMGDLELPYASFSADKLYSSEHSWVDLNVDENGLWAVHSLVGSNNTAIVKIHADLEGMEILYGWNVTISHIYAGDMFVICGVLYAVDSTTERDTKIRLALDLYRRTLLKVDLKFNNPFRHTMMVSYNPRTKELFTWDNRNQLTFPIKYTDIGYDIKDENKERTTNDLYSGYPMQGYPTSA